MGGEKEHAAPPPKVVMLFLDGVGLGEEDPAANPLVVAPTPRLRSLLGGLPLIRSSAPLTLGETSLQILDATLGVEGLPQSGTGQASLLTGVNGARMMGRHFGPYPPSMLRELLAQKGLFGEFVRRGKRVCYANAFPRRFEEYRSHHPWRVTGVMLCYLATGLPLRGAEDLAVGRGISGDVTGRGWKDLGHPEVRTVGAEEAGRRLARLAREADFTLFEYWLTDKAGHSRSMEESIRCLELLDGLVGGFLDEVERGRTLLLVTSDHGNLEDLRTRSHTRNPVPALFHGCGHARAAGLLGAVPGVLPDLTAVAPALIGTALPEAAS
ncbi:MAG: hypothetical protein WB626_05615 [Bacteroidota bacterium]